MKKAKLRVKKEEAKVEKAEEKLNAEVDKEEKAEKD